MTHPYAEGVFEETRKIQSPPFNQAVVMVVKVAENPKGEEFWPQNHSADFNPEQGSALTPSAMGGE